MARSIFVAAMAGALFCTCSFFSEYLTCSLSLPPLPEAYEQVVRSWEVVLFREDGARESITLPPGKERLVLSLGREETVGVLCYPRGPGSFDLKPAGCYLFRGETGDGRITFEKGPALVMLESLAEDGPGDFNGPRLIREMEIRRTGSPWNWDAEETVKKIREGTFSLVKLREKALFPLLWSSYDDHWLSHDPFVRPRRDETLLLPAGRHRFYHPPTDRIRDVLIDSEGKILEIEYSPPFM